MSKLAYGDALEDPGPSVVTPLLTIGRALVSRPGSAIDLARQMARERWLLTAALGLAESLAILDLAAARLGALAVDLPDALVVASHRDVESGAAL